MCACVCMPACVHDVFAIYDNNTLPRLIKVIIKIIFLYFIEIAHTDDFPSTGTRLAVPASIYKYLHNNDVLLKTFDIMKLILNTAFPITIEPPLIFSYLR